MNDTIVPDMVQEIVNRSPEIARIIADELQSRDMMQESHVLLFPGVNLTVTYSATFGELLVATLLILLIAMHVTMFFHRLIFGKRGD